MAYTGDSGLDPKVQQRIMTAFAEAVRLYREGHPEESLTILRSIADVDAQFKPAQRLEAAINASAPVDLAQLLGEMSAAAGQDAAVTVAKAREAFEQRDFSGALSLAQTVLKDLPGHAEARKLVFEAQSRLRTASEVEVARRAGARRTGRRPDPGSPGVHAAGPQPGPEPPGAGGPRWRLAGASACRGGARVRVRGLRALCRDRGGGTSSPPRGAARSRGWPGVPVLRAGVRGALPCRTGSGGGKQRTRPGGFWSGCSGGWGLAFPARFGTARADSRPY